MATFPESMERLDVNDPTTSLSIVENYIRYMCERTEFSMRNMTKIVSQAGISSAELYILLQAQAQVIATLQSTLNQLSGTVNGLATTVAALRLTVGDANSGLVKDVAGLSSTVGDANSGLVKDMATAQADIVALQEIVGDTTTPDTILYALADLDQRVTALEQQNNNT